ncbi:ATP-dependent endonuclease [Fusobacterium sp. HMSC064B11]|uniref:AAA family ATPase n=1 Tax=Fusobacterium sp. HMSC064B11 TaxID=1739543 RepID=UPI0008A393AE|nr:AAA family ATPase [Fusobacterium sp. HMSC064B11]OFO28050.1 ATP-dependent endonuclease [Fusobacterium sp. HMSC064B11]
MVLKKIVVENFRLLKNFKLELKDELSLIIGKNNCGKTSVLVILDKMLNSYEIVWEDVNLVKQKELYNEINEFNGAVQEENKFLEAIKLQLYIEYSDINSYENIQNFIMDLEPENNIILLEFISSINIKNILELKDIIKEREIKDFSTFSRYMSKNFTKYFKIKKYSRGYDKETKKLILDMKEEIDSKNIQKVIKVTGIRADRAVSNDEGNHALSILTSRYYETYRKNIKDESNSIFQELEVELEKADRTLYKIYNGEKADDGKDSEGIFRDIIDVVKNYGGYDNGINISIESSISEKNLLTNNTSLYYKHGDGDSSSLPETYNGLGYLNLIGILFEIETKLQELYEQPADINILYIEEPEAHTHPQLQYIFIRNIKNHINSHRNKLNKEKNKYLQIIITSHSSHIVSECNFDDIIYLKRIDNNILAKNFNSLKEEYGGDEKKEFKFVKQYLTLNRSELFFADKVICIEGDTERILMPAMMYKVDKMQSSKNKSTIPLLSQNISVIEVGAYSHVFIPLFVFLGIKALIITDIDSATKNNNGKYEKSHPNNATHTSNASIREFFKEDGLDYGNNQFKELIEKKEKDKIKDRIRIAYQIPEIEGDYQASSFEDAFISLNKDFILRNKDNLYDYGALKNFSKKEINNDFYKFSLNKIEKKSTFASALLYFDEEENDMEWKVPRYIKEGLLWIQEF